MKIHERSRSGICFRRYILYYWLCVLRTEEGKDMARLSSFTKDQLAYYQCNQNIHIDSDRENNRIYFKLTACSRFKYITIIN